MSHQQTDRSKANILITDDTPNNLRLLAGILTEQGYKVRPASNGSRALATAQLAPPDLILLDIRMPGMDGYEVCQKLKADERTRNIPVIFISALNSTLDKVKAFSLGAVDYITKPFQAEEVLARVETHLAVHRLRKELEEKNIELQQEIIERKRTEAKLAHVSKLKDEFLANMSHEIRTPLNVILGMSEALQEKVYGELNDKILHCIHRIEESGHHLLQLINDILDLSKINAGKLELTIKPVSVEPMCQASVAFIRQLVRKKRIKFLSTCDHNITTFYADELRIKQVLVNLLTNAVKFTPEEGSVGLEVESDIENQTIKFIVWDTGIGIAGEDMERLFEPFEQLKSSTFRQDEGTGLGLSLVYRLVQLHGGNISVESEVGKGSRFTVSLPWNTRLPPSRGESSTPSPSRADSDLTEKNTPLPPSRGESTQSTTRTILIADDSVGSIETFST